MTPKARLSERVRVIREQMLHPATIPLLADWPDELNAIADEIAALEARVGVTEDLIADNYHYWRECPNCGHAGNHYLHCPHDRNQSKCVRCDMELPYYPGDCECEFVVTIPELERTKEGAATTTGGLDPLESAQGSGGITEAEFGERRQTRESGQVAAPDSIEDTGGADV